MTKWAILMGIRLTLFVSLIFTVFSPTLVLAYDDLYPGLDRVLMLGDSITQQVNTGVTPTARGIGWQVQDAFAGLANVHLIPENIQDTDYALSNISPGVSHIESWINGETWDVINFNTGLHDMKLTDSSKYDPPTSYATKLGLVIDEIQAHSGSATLIWRETTFVPNPEGNNRHKAVDGVTPMDEANQYYNAAAALVVGSKGITLVDSIASLSASVERVAANNVHYTNAGYQELAKPVVEQIYEQIDIAPGLRVDLGDSRDSESYTRVQEGYHDYHFYMPSPLKTNTSLVATNLGERHFVEVTLSNTSSVAHWNDPITGAGEELSKLLQDFVYTTAAFAPLEVAISGLTAGTYSFTGYFHDCYIYQGVADVDVSVDGGQNFTDMFRVPYSTGYEPTSIGTGSSMFTCDGVNDIVVHISADNTNSGNGTTAFNGFEVSPLIPGDANNDGRVDGSDVTILANNWQYGVSGTPNATWTMGDFNGDGRVDGSDVTILANNWQYGVTAATATVPEPSILVLLLMGMVALSGLATRESKRR